MATKKKTADFKKAKYLLLIVAVATLATIAFLTLRTKTPVNQRVVTAGRSSPTEAPKDTNSQVNKTPGSNSGSRDIGNATDTNGTASSSTNSNQWVTSASDVITVKQPLANAKFQNGDTLSGSSKVSPVHYRLSDNKVGVISQGVLNVVNGNFSGAIHFNPQGTGGRLDVFSTDTGGVEYNEIQINVSF